MPYELRPLQLHIRKTRLHFLRRGRLRSAWRWLCGGRCGANFAVVSTQNTKHYELLNYSEHGTTVDNVLYSCDFSEKASPSPPGGLVAKVQGIIRECRLTNLS